MDQNEISPRVIRFRIVLFGGFKQCLRKVILDIFAKWLCLLAPLKTNHPLSLYWIIMSASFVRAAGNRSRHSTHIKFPVYEKRVDFSITPTRST